MNTKPFEVALSVIQSVAIVVSLVFSIRGFRAYEARTSAETMLKYSELLDSGTDLKIYNALEHDQSILKEHKGKFTSDELEQFLEDLELLDDAYEGKVINDSMAYDAFSEEIDRVVQNPEIAAYLAVVRRTDPTYFVGIGNLKDAFDEYKKRNPE